MSLKTKFIILTCVMAWFGRDGARAQPPDCTLPINIPIGSAIPFNLGPFDNRTAGCTTWQITYNSIIYSAVSIVVQTAPNATGGVPGSWSTFTAVTGSNPNTATTQAVSTFGGVTSYFPWLRVQLTSATGAGTISGRLYGWRIPPATGSITATVCPGGTPCVVVGDKSNNAVVPGSTNLGVLPGLANAATPTWTEGDQVAVSVDLSGNQRVSPFGVASAQGDGATNTPTVPTALGAASVQPGYMYGFNAVTWDRIRTVPAADAGGSGSGVGVLRAGLTINDGAGTVRSILSASQAGDASSATFFPPVAGMAFNGATWDRIRGNTVGLFVQGAKTNNAAAPGATNIGVIPAIANAAAPSWTEGNLVLNSVNLAGSQRTVLDAETTKVIGTVRNLGNVGAAFDAATGAAPPANGILFAGLGSGATGGFMTAMPVCDSFYNINIVTATTTLAITGVSGRHVRICHIDMVASAADNVGIISGTGATCGTGTAAIVGTTAGTGYNWAANTGISAGTGIGTIMRTVATGDSVCLITSAAVQLSGVISYTIY